MRASRWDSDAEIGGGWRVVLRRQAGSGAVPFAQPTRMDLWKRGADPAVDTPLKTVVAVIATDELSAGLTLSVDEVTALGPGGFEHRVLATDKTGRTVVLMRGTLILRGSAGDL